MPTQTTAQPNVSELKISFRLWIVIVLTGAGSGLAGGLLMTLLRAVQHLSYSYLSREFLVGVEGRADSLMIPLLIAVAGATVTARRFSQRSVYALNGD